MQPPPPPPLPRAALKPSEVAAHWKSGQTPPGSFLGQFGAAVKKNVIQKKRSCASCCLEVFLPILFVLAMMGIWAATAPQDYPGANFLNTTSLNIEAAAIRAAYPDLSGGTTAAPSPTTTAAGTAGPTTAAPGVNSLSFYDLSLLKYFYCVNGTTVTGLRTCSPATDFAVSSPYKCIADTSYELCYSSSAPGIVGAYAFGFPNARLIPTLDQIVLLMYTAKATIPNSRFGQVTSPSGAMSHAGKLHFVQHPYTAPLIAWLKANQTLFARWSVGQVFADFGKADSFMMSAANEGTTWGAVQLNTVSATTLEFTLHFNRSGIRGPTK